MGALAAEMAGSISLRFVPVRLTLSKHILNPIMALTKTVVRIGGAALVIDVENNPSNLTTLLPPATILNTVALSPLMGCTLSFLRRR